MNPKLPAREPRFAPLANLLECLGGGAQDRRAADLLRQRIDDHSAARFDANAALLDRHRRALAAAWRAVPRQARAAVRAFTAEGAGVPSGDPDAAADRLATVVLDLCGGSAAALDLAAALVRFAEDVPRLVAPRTIPLGVGCENLLDLRVRARVDVLRRDQRLLLALHGNHRQLLLEEPDEALARISAALGRPLDANEQAWLDLERRAGILRFVRRRKTDSDGHIRWYVRLDSQRRPVLARLGTCGHWLLFGLPDPTRLAGIAPTLAGIVESGATPDGAWNVVAVRGELPVAVPAAPPTSAVPLAAAYAVPAAACRIRTPEILAAHLRRHLALVADAPGLAAAAFTALAAARRGIAPAGTAPWGAAEIVVREDRIQLVCSRQGEPEQALASIPLDANDDEILDFSATLQRVADLRPPLDRTGSDDRGYAAVAWVRAFLRTHLAVAEGTGRLAGSKVRLVYVPSSIPHMLGGAPKLGPAFLADHLERLGARADVTSMPAEAIDDRVVEILGADVVGISLFIHNRDAAAQIIRRLREHGFDGKVVLGGPEVRNIDSVLESIQGWDAVIRGEGEEVLPLVLDFFRLADAGDIAGALAIARGLRGVALRCGNALLLCDTAAKNRASAISSPLPYGWGRHGQRRVKMNFSRGCPYLCTFCPNHQGRHYRAGPVDEMWSFAVLAVAYDLPIVETVAHDLAFWVQHRADIAGPPRLRLAVDLLLRSQPRRDELAAWISRLAPAVGPEVWGNPGILAQALGIDEDLQQSLASLGGRVDFWQAKRIWLLAKAQLLAARQLTPGSAAPGHRQANPLPPLVLETSEDNTLVNRAAVSEFLARREAYGLQDDFLFNPGQNTIRDLLLGNGRGVDEAFVERLVKYNRCAINFGADGTSNAILRQNRKPLYGVTGILAVNRVLCRHGLKVVNNYILLTPESTLLDAVESIVLFLILPVQWRDYSSWNNLRVVREETTLATDESMILAPEDMDYDLPFRFPEVQSLLDRWSLSSRVPTAELRPLLRRIVREDPEVGSSLPWVLARWTRDIDADPELVALAARVRAERQGGESVAEPLLRLEGRLDLLAPVGG
jgi:B12 binding domain